MNKYLTRTNVITVLLSFFCFLASIGSTALVEGFIAKLGMFGLLGALSTLFIVCIYTPFKNEEEIFTKED